MHWKLSVKTLILVGVWLFLTVALSEGKLVSNEKQQSVNEQAPQADNRSLKELLAILQDESLRAKDPQQVFRAIERVGEMRSTEAIGTLIKLLEFKRTFDWEDSEGKTLVHPITPAGRYPAAGALFQIG